MLRRIPLARYTLAQLSPAKIAEFRDDRLKAGKSRSTVRSKYLVVSGSLKHPIKSHNFKLAFN